MLNLSRYNLSNFNLLQEQETVSYIDAMYAAVGAMVSNGGDEYLQESMVSDLRTRLSAGPAEEIKEKWGAQVRAAAFLSPALWLREEMEEQVQATVNCGQDIYLQTRQESGTQALTGLGCDILFKEAQKTDVLSQAEIGCDIYIGLLFPALTNAQISSYIIEDQQAFLNVSIPPGGTLVVDSQNDNVLLGGQSVIWVHEGDWVWISRETMDLSVRCAAGSGLESRILYTERFL